MSRLPTAGRTTAGLTRMLSQSGSLADQRAEWLEPDGLGGFTSSTVSGVRTRRYHGLLTAALTPPTGRVVLVNGAEVWLETTAGPVALSSQRYAPEIIHPDGASRIDAFERDPWPRWTFRLDNGARIEQSLFVRHGTPLVVMRWRLLGGRRGARGTLAVRPLLSGRDYHALHRENPGFRFDAAVDGEQVRWRPYEPLPAILARSNGAYSHEPIWYRNFIYDEERRRGLDHLEDLASPGVFRWDLSRGEAVWILGVEGHGLPAPLARLSTAECAERLAQDERRRRERLPDALLQSADAYIARRGSGRTVIAGYPWFTDWGRDSFIALRGLCLATGWLETARKILVEWAATVSRGMLPNRFPDDGEPEYNSVDASLWYVVTVHELLQAAARDRARIPDRDRSRLLDAVAAILTGFANGTRYRIQLDEDGLLAAGEPGVALTWMDARIDGRPVTARIGKPVEIQALWLNALWIGSRIWPRWGLLFEHGRDTFQDRFWHQAGGYLYDVIDCDHQRGSTDPAFRANQVFAVGGLPVQILTGRRAQQVVDAVEQRLVTPIGLRSLAPGEPGYAPRYAGGPRERDSAYHQGTVWPWLMGPFVEAWVRARGGTDAAKRRARRQFLEPLLAHLQGSGLGHLPEVADGDAPHAPGGCPFQAWSLGEAIRLDRVVLAASIAGRRRSTNEASQAAT